MESSTINDITVRGSGTKKNVGELPEVAYFRVQSRGGVGTVKDFHDRKVGAWALLVSCKDGKGLRLATDVAYEFGMKFKGEFATREEAIEAGKNAIKAWGKKAERKAAKAKGPTKADLIQQIEDLKHQLALKAA